MNQIKNNQSAYRLMDTFYWTVDGAVDRTLDDAVYEAVDEAEYRSVVDAVYRTLDWSVRDLR